MCRSSDQVLLTCSPGWWSLVWSGGGTLEAGHWGRWVRGLQGFRSSVDAQKIQKYERGGRASDGMGKDALPEGPTSLIRLPIKRHFACFGARNKRSTVSSKSLTTALHI